MKKSILALGLWFAILFAAIEIANAQCNNADFENGNFTGWTATWGDGTVRNVTFPPPLPQIGIPYCYYPDPYQHTGFNSGPLNSAPGYSPLVNQVITNSGNDLNLAGMGYNLPVVYPGGGTYSARLGNSHADDLGHGGGESMSYSFTVTPNNVNFTYHYAAVLNDGGHSNTQQPYFQIRMYDGSNNPISCAAYDVDANSAQTIGGFIHPGGVSDVWVKPWTSVFVPLNSYMGQTVKLTFTTRDCMPGVDSTICFLGTCLPFLGILCDGSHYAYAYVDAECAPMQVVASSPAICAGQGVTLTAPAGAATYSWTGPGVVPPSNTQSVVVNQPGTYHVAMTVLGQCSSTFTIDTTIAAGAQGAIANFTATTVCLGNPTTFTDASTPPGTTPLAWDFDNNGTTDATTQSPTHTFAAAGTYPVKLTIGSPPCTDDTTINVTVSPAPNSTFTASGPVCLGANSSIVYTGNAPANATYTWNFDGGTVVSGSGQGPYSVNWSTGGVKNITLMVSIGSCVSGQTTVPVTVNNAVGLTVSPSVTICNGASTQLTASGGSSYTWSPSTGLSGTSGASVTASPTTTTTYSVTDVGASCSNPSTVTVSVTPVPTSAFTASSPVCAGQNSTVTYTGNASTSATYTWNYAGGTIASGSGQGPYQVNWATAGVKNITLTVSENGCTSTMTNNNVTVNPGPTSTFTATSPLCVAQNSSVTYAGAATVGATYTWNFDGGTTVSGSGQGPYQITWATAGTKNVTLTVSENGCTSQLTTVPVIVGVVPTSSFTASSPVCAGQNSTITYTGNATSTATYTWNFSGGTVASGSGQGPYQVNWTTAGNQTVTLDVSENGCSSTPTNVTVVVNPAPTATFTTSSPVCVGANSTITYTGTGSASANYTWSFDGGTAASGSGQGPYQVNWAISGTKVITLSIDENGCTSTSNVNVVVNPIPTATLNATTPLCLGNTSTITYTGSATAGATYTWDFDSGNIISGSGQGPYSIDWSTAGTKNITLLVSENGCQNNGATTVDVHPLPVADFTADTLTGCENLAVCFTDISVSTNPSNYQWTFGDGQSATTQNPCHTFASPGTYSISLTVNSADGCSDAVSYTNLITVVANPVADFSINPSLLQLPDSRADMVNLSQHATNYLWNFDGAGTSTDVSPRFIVSAPGSYAISLYAYNQFGCFDSAVHNLTVLAPDAFFIPNVFTPNGDGNNDFFNILSQEGLEVLKFEIFNRWGEKVHDDLYPWDGMYKGKQAPPGVYVYIFSLKMASESQAVIRKGSVTLIR